MIRYARSLLAVFVFAVLVAVLAASPALAGFGFLPGAAGFDGSFVNRDGSPDTQAGSHPYAFTASIQVTRFLTSEGKPFPVGDAKDITLDLPAGFIGDPNATAKCTPEQLSHTNEAGAFEPGTTCPVGSQVGVAVVELAQGINEVREHLAVFNLVAPAGEPAVLGFNVSQVNVYINTRVRSGSDYGLSSFLRDTPASLPTLGSTVTLWGVPGDSSHDVQRCVYPNFSSGGNCENPNIFGGRPHEFDGPRKPFLTLPTSCAGPQTISLAGDSWQEPGIFAQDSFITHDNAGNPVGFEGCNRLSFTPSIVAQPDTSEAATPSGLHVDVHLPQNDYPEGLAESELKDAVVTLPAGVSVNPSSADGLQTCSEAQIALSSPEPATCPEASKVASVEVISPAIDHPILGSVFVATQNENPFHSLLALYISVYDPQTGIVVKVPMDVKLDPQTGQLKTTVQNSPQLPFEDLKLDFFAGPRAPLVTPGSCGTFTTTSDMTPWSSPGLGDATPSDSFAVTSGVGGAACGNGFAPVFTAGTTNNQAGAFSPFSVSISRSDQEQALSGVTVNTPPGLLGIIKGVERCPEPQASQGTCGPGSLIGHATAAAGAGPDPFNVSGGQVFLTGPYKGAPFGLSIVVPAVAGPFNLGNVVVRSAINVDPHTAQISIVSDPLPTILQGIPLLVKKVNVTIDRTGFMFNPTNCASLNVGGTLRSAQGTSTAVSSHFQAANCATLPFKPTFKATTQANTSKKNGASLDVKVTSGLGPGGQSQANIGKAGVTLPKQLPARLTTIQQACTEVAFAANPASCPTGSNIGTVTARTPVLASTLTGPAYLVSHGGAAFPDIVVVLQGEGVTLDLVGSINIKHGVTSSAFDSVPDAPISSFELKLPEGPHSGLAAVVPAKAKGNLCGTSLTMPTTLTGQNGAQIKQSTKIAVTGCTKAKKAHKKHKAKKTKRRK
ncbi:MAG TPA: hypothetical protein VIC06_11345 [Solirubrobacteraceae bacterium]